MNQNISIRENKFYIIIGMLYSILPILLISQLLSAEIAFVFLMGIPLIATLIFNFEIIKYLVVTSLFSNLFISGLYLSVYSVFILLLSFLIVHRDISTDLFRTPISKALMIYFFAILPSLFNSSKIFLSLFLMNNFFSFAILIYIVGYVITETKEIKNILTFFTTLTILDSLFIIIKSIGGNLRIFGFSGVVIVDYSALIILFFISKLFFHPENSPLKKVLLSLGILLLIVAMIITQTRNSFLSLFISIVLIMLFLLFNKKTFSDYGKKILIVFFSILIFFAISAIILSSVKPSAFGRFEELGKTFSMEIKSESDFGRSSLFTRLLIWDTALNAFNHHPIIGIGAYSFPFESVRYYTISKILYKEFVESLSVHIGYLAVLTETGLIGLIGFLILLYSIIRMSIKSVKISKTALDKYYSFVLFAFQIYIIISLLLTDAWLWGQCGTLWGLLAGLSVANHKILLKQSS
ncbi:O-antigen ligase family protein [Ignavibacterium sp.]|uniref:O-antigen ligase family protein n=1 Tax=Ignavibacterium sp. TaxID=2651167 RepID=UPI0021FA13F1|nr:O-antigen ligase family protein [Ignavibacterium sp.]BDQ04191.1 MAG: hypothetical protein KatS3mg037_2766 [Ignavibacterium sp.]